MTAVVSRRTRFNMRRSLCVCLYLLVFCKNESYATKYRSDVFRIGTMVQSSSGFGPNDMYCAYCRRRGWWTCIKRYCADVPSSFLMSDTPRLIPGYYTAPGFRRVWMTGYHKMG